MKRFLAMALAVLMVISVAPMSILAATPELNLGTGSCDFYNLIEKNDYNLAPGAVESEIIINDDGEWECPQCGNDVVIRMSRKGRRYYGCINNPECEFMSWAQPSKEKCPNCGTYTVIKGNKIVCADAQCGCVLEGIK